MILSRSIIIWISLMSEFCLLRTKWQEAVSLRNILTQHNLQLFCQERYHAFIQTDSFSIICVNLEHWSVRRLSHDLLVTIPGIKRIQEQHHLSQCVRYNISKNLKYMTTKVLYICLISLEATKSYCAFSLLYTYLADRSWLIKM